LVGATVSTTATAFQLNNNGLTLTGGGVIPLSAGVTGLYQGTGQVLWIHCAGTVTGFTANSSTLALQLYQVPASLLPIANTLAAAQSFTSWNSIGSQSAASFGTTETAGSFTFDAYVQLDAQGNLMGYYDANIGATTKAQTVITPITGLVGEQDLNFVLVATIGTAAPAGAIVTLDELSLNYV
jgi:hypothetical protein